MSLPPPPPSPGSPAPDPQGPPPGPPIAPEPAPPSAPTQGWDAAPAPAPTQGWDAAPPPGGQQPITPSYVTPPPPQQPPKKGSKRGLVIVGVIVLAIVGIYGFTSWQKQQTFDAGHAAYLKADCKTAVDKLGDVSDGDSDMAVQAAAEESECRDLLAADVLAQTDAPRAILAYSNLITKVPESSLVGAAQGKAQALLSGGDPADLATTDLCDALPALETQRLVASPDTMLPALLIACGNAYEAEQDYTDALIVLDRFLRDYKDHELAPSVEEAFARVTIADAAESGAGELPPPRAVGESGEAGDLVKVRIQNDSPNSMSIVFKGPDTRVERLEPCAECTDYKFVGPLSCPEKGPIGEYVMQPGTYDVVVKAADSASVTPFRGTWELGPGDEYYSCFYLVTR